MSLHLQLLLPRSTPMGRWALAFATLLAVVLSATSAQATNGISLIGASARSQGLGGVTTPIQSSLADSLLSNPAQLGAESVRGAPRFELTLNQLLLDVQAKNSAPIPFGGRNQLSRSQVKWVPVPTLAAEWSLGGGVSVGAGAVAEAGISSNQNGVTDLLELKPELAVFKIPLAVSVARPFAQGTFRAGIAPHLSVAQYAVNSSDVPGTRSQSVRRPQVALGGGVTLGLGQSWAGHRIGASYRSSSRFRLRDYADLDSFGPLSRPGLDTLSLETPEQWSVGYAWEPVSSLTLALDYKRIQWGKASGFQEFGWDNQNALAMGAEYRSGIGEWRAGFNWSTPVYRSRTGIDGARTVSIGTSQVYESSVQFLNVVGFPAINTRVLTAGYGLALGDWRLDLAVAHAFRERIQRAGTAAFGTTFDYTTEIASTNVVTSVSWALR